MVSADTSQGLLLVYVSLLTLAAVLASRWIGPVLVPRTLAGPLVATSAVAAPLVVVPGTAPSFWVPGISALMAASALAVMATLSHPPARRTLLMLGLIAPTQLMLAITPGREIPALLATAGLLLALASARLRWSWRGRVLTLIAAMGAYVAANAVVWVTRGEAAELVALRSLGGLLDRRIQFPLATNWAESAFVAAALVAACIVLLVRGRDRARLLVLPLLAVGGFLLIANDGRVPLAASIVVPIVALLAPLALAFAAPLVAGLALAVPWWWPAVGARGIGAFEWLADVAPFLARRTLSEPASLEFATLNARTAFWEGAASTIDQAEPTAFLLGWGWRSGVTSGAADVYERNMEELSATLNPLSARFLQERFVEPSVPEAPVEFVHHSAHSAVLQGWLDAGLVGALYLIAAVLIVVVLAARSVSVSRDVHALALLAAAVVFSISAGVDYMLTPMALQLSWWFFLMAGVIVIDASSRAKALSPNVRP